ncbi:hypothetical protein IWX76_000057 [Pedobacter sp. CAN_A7]|uniref:hypothetical protein n=1 Tax=Pedobacter sp. CAN_A7 TaxID=2787722 RepID=UPI0018CAB4B7
MAKYTVTLDAAKRAALGDQRSDFLIKAFERFLTIQEKIKDDSVSPAIKLLCLKEIFAIFSEIEQFSDVSATFQPTNIIVPVFAFVTFLRNVLLHFPIYNSWNDIQISADLANDLSPNHKGSSISKYLNANVGMQDLDMTLVTEFGELPATLRFSAIKNPVDLIFLKDIITEDEVVNVLLGILLFVYTTKVV